MIETKWFISYKVYSYGTPPREHSIVTDVTPARWVLYRKESTKDECFVLYAEEISPALAAELQHTAKIEADFYKEGD